MGVQVELGWGALAGQAVARRRPIAGEAGRVAVRAVGCLLESSRWTLADQVAPVEVEFPNRSITVRASSIGITRTTFAFRVA